jgi:PAS domain S-box-containing protein
MPSQTNAILAWIDQIPVGIYICNAAGFYSATNRAWQLLFGLNQHESLGNAWLKHIHPADQTLASAQWQSAIDQQATFEMNYRIVLPDGEVRQVLSQATPQFDAKGQLTHYIGNVEDITALQKLSQQVSEREQRFSHLLQHIPGMAYRRRNDATWTLLECSAGCLALTGYSAEDLIDNHAMSFASLIHPEDAEWLPSLCQHNIAHGLHFSHEYRIIAADGSERWVWDQADGILD